VAQNCTQVGVGVVAVEAQKAPPRQGLVPEQAPPVATVPFSGTQANTDVPPLQVRSHFCPPGHPVCATGSHAATAPSMPPLPFPLPHPTTSASAKATGKGQPRPTSAPMTLTTTDGISPLSRTPEPPRDQT
jgi:hypothetical protein